MSRAIASFPPPHAFQLFMGLDFGLKRTGVAVGTRLLGSAKPVTTIVAQGKARFPAIEKFITEWQPHALVVGIPWYPDGQAHDNTRLALQFSRQLQGRFNLMVYEVDERYSTTEAIAMGASDVDAQAASIILEQFFRSFE